VAAYDYEVLTTTESVVVDYATAPRLSLLYEGWFTLLPGSVTLPPEPPEVDFPFLIQTPHQPASALSPLPQVDIDVLDDLPPTFRLAYGPKVLANYIARELITPEGVLAVSFEGDPEYGYDVRGRLNSAWSVRELSSLAAAIEGKIKRHERVQGVEVEVSHSLATSTLSVHIEIETAAGPFKFVLAVTDVSVAILHPE
jgi:hypothetical protein